MLIGPWTHRRIRVVIEMTTIMMLLLIEVLKAFCLQNSAEIPCCCLIDKCIDIQQFQVTKAHWWQFVFDEVIDSRCVKMCLCFGHVTNLVVDVHKENYFFFSSWYLSLIFRDFSRRWQWGGEQLPCQFIQHPLIGACLSVSENLQPLHYGEVAMGIWK